jgi:polyferredoxin
MQPKPPDVAWKLIAFTGYYLLLIGIVYLLIPQLLSSRTLEYLSMDGRMQMLMLHRYGGIALIAASLAIVAIASNSLRRGERCCT